MEKDDARLLRELRTILLELVKLFNQKIHYEGRITDRQIQLQGYALANDFNAHERDKHGGVWDHELTRKMQEDISKELSALREASARVDAKIESLLAQLNGVGEPSGGDTPS